MRGRRLLAALVATSLMAVAPHAVAAPAVPLDVRGGSLATALNDVARQAGVELLFDRKLVRGMNARPFRGRLSADAAFSRLLAGTGVGYRVTPQGAYVLFALPAARPAPAVEAADGAIAELLVVGRRTQNVDIRRTEDDIQPYRIIGRREIEASGLSTVDDVLRTRESANAQAGPLSLTTGDPRSSIDLRGLGPTSTVVLVDGRRMPQVPTAGFEFSQSDINGIPIGAIERIEVLTTTAGGIYGPGALGGVVNVVLRRDYRGADVTVQGGITDRGDAEEGRVEARLGFTPDKGATDMMLVLAHRRAAPLLIGQRDYLERAGRRAFANDPEGYADDLIRTRNGVSVVSLDGNLTLDPAFGGQALGSRFTYLPIGFSGTPREAGAVLAANAGQLPLELSDDLTGKRGYIDTAPKVTSALVNVRRGFGRDVEAFVDGFYARNQGHIRGALEPGPFRIGPATQGNPFGQTIALRFPQAVLDDETRYTYDVRRATGGVIVDLHRGWKATADYTVGETRLSSPYRHNDPGLLGAVASGVVAPFGNWADVVAALPAYSDETVDEAQLRNRLHDASLRISGPVLTLPGGPLTVTLVGEDRKDRIDDALVSFFGFPITVSSRSQAVQSAYAELRAPLGAADAANPLLRGLELQLAVRGDRTVLRGPKAALAIESDRFSVTQQGATFTAGARVSPSRALMLRGSVATGERPPTLGDLQALSTDFIFINGVPDPRRDGRPVGTEAPTEYLLGGSLRVGPARARSVTVGAVLNPGGGTWPRLSLDYSRIEVTREPAVYLLDPEGLLAAEALYPDRVVRAPVTAADRAAGFAVGPVIRMDFAASNSGRTLVEAVDAKLDWLLPDMNVGDVRLYGSATWQPTFKRSRPGQPNVNRASTPENPLEWRGNAGVAWTIGPTVVDLNAQYYGRYRVSSVLDTAEQAARVIRAEGAENIPAQLYVDVSIRRRLQLSSSPRRRGAVDARLSILNLFDHSPPIVATSTNLGFSEYGDPRRRRVVMSLTAQF